VTELSLCS